MKKIFAFVICFSLIYFSAQSQTAEKIKPQITAKDIQGNWTLTSLEGNNSSRVLSSAEKLISTKNYLHDFPLNTTTLNLSGSDFSMTHHVGGIMFGTFDVVDPVLTLHAVPGECSDCKANDFIFIIRSSKPGLLQIDIYDDDSGGKSYASLTFTKK